MMTSGMISIPSLVRIKQGALGRIGLYCRRSGFTSIALLHSDDLPAKLLGKVQDSLIGNGITVCTSIACGAATFSEAERIFASLSADVGAVVGVGGGKALDVAKYVAFLARLPYLALPTSLSNDGFCSPGVSLILDGRKRSLPAAMPFGVVVDTEVCLAAPKRLWFSGIGDLVAKFTAVRDWKLAFHATGEPVNDFAALLSDATVFQFIARPQYDIEGVRLLATSLMLNGIAMEICGSSRPASGGEHLISHALDRISARPALHGLQVGMATYLISRLQGVSSELINEIFSNCGFWEEIINEPFCTGEWLEAIKIAPTLKSDFYTVLSSRDCSPEVAAMIASDPCLAGCFY